MTGRVVRVRRTGGFAGLTTQGEVDLDADPDDELSNLVAAVAANGLGRLTGLATTHADRFTYSFDLCGDQATVPEQHLTDDLRRVAVLVLGAGRRPGDSDGDVE